MKNLLCFCLLLLPTRVLAAVIPEPGGSDKDVVGQIGYRKGVGNEFEVGSVKEFVNSLFNNVTAVFLLIMGSLAVLIIIWSGIQYITANGNMDTMKKARQSIINTLLAIILIISVYAILGLIIGVLNGIAKTAGG